MVRSRCTRGARARPRREHLGLAAAALFIAGTAHAQAVPERVRLMRPACDGPIAWDALRESLRVELRSVGSDLDEGGSEPAARLSLDAGCAETGTTVDATLEHVPSGRSVTEPLEVGRGDDRIRVLALGLSELVRSRWPSLATEPAPATAPVPAPVPVPVAESSERVAGDRLRALVQREVEAQLPRTPVVERPGVFVDVAVAVSAYPASTHAMGELRAGVSIPLAPSIRLGAELAGGGGWAGDPLGDVALYTIGGAGALRFAHETEALVIGAGPRIDLGYTHARGIPSSDAVRGSSLGALHAAVGLDARVRAHLDGSAWLLVAAELGVSLAGIDARADDRRVTAQTGPRLGLAIGVAFH